MAKPVVRYEVGKRMSEASKFNGIIHLAGQVAEDATQDITGQTKQVLQQVDKLLAASGSDKSRLLMVQIFLANVARDFAAMNSVYDTWVVPGQTSPRATVRAWAVFAGAAQRSDSEPAPPGSSGPGGSFLADRGCGDCCGGV